MSIPGDTCRGAIKAKGDKVLIKNKPPRSMSGNTKAYICTTSQAIPSGALATAPQKMDAPTAPIVQTPVRSVDPTALSNAPTTTQVETLETAQPLLIS